MAYIGAKPNELFRVAPTKDTFTGDGSTVAFDLANAVPAGGEFALQVFIDNVRQEPGSGKAFTLGVDGSGDMKRITFTAAPASSSEIYVLTNFDNEAFINTDLNGQELQLDADGDTTITADTDDQIDIKIAGSDDFQFTANTFTAQSGSSIVVPESGLKFGSTSINSTAAELNLLDGSAKSTASITIADTDAIIVIDGNTTKQIPASDLKTYNPGFTVSTITGATELAEQPAATDEIVLSDAGTLKRLDIKHIQNTPSFFASLSANQSIATGTYVKVAYNVELYDSDNTYDNSSNYRFTPGVAGKYVIGAKHRLDTSTDGSATILSIYKNGSTFLRTRFTLDNSEGYHTSAILDLDNDDYVEIYAYQNSGGTTNISGGTLGSDDTIAYFYGFRVAGV